MKNFPFGDVKERVKTARAVISYQDLLDVGEETLLPTGIVIPANSVLLSIGFGLVEELQGDGNSLSQLQFSLETEGDLTAGYGDFSYFNTGTNWGYPGTFAAHECPITVAWRLSGSDTTLLQGILEVNAVYLHFGAPAAQGSGSFNLTADVTAKTLAATPERNGHTLTLARETVAGPGPSPATDTLETGATDITIASLSGHAAANGVDFTLTVSGEEGGPDAFISGTSENITIAVRLDGNTISGAQLVTLLETGSVGLFALQGTSSLLDNYVFTGGGATLLEQGGVGDGSTASLSGGNDGAFSVSTSGTQAAVTITIQDDGGGDLVTTEILAEVLTAQASGTYEDLVLTFSDAGGLLSGLKFSGGDDDPIVEDAEGDGVVCTISGGRV